MGKEISTTPERTLERHISREGRNYYLHLDILLIYTIPPRFSKEVQSYRRASTLLHGHPRSRSHLRNQAQIRLITIHGHRKMHRKMNRIMLNFGASSPSSGGSFVIDRVSPPVVDLFNPKKAGWGTGEHVDRSDPNDPFDIGETIRIFLSIVALWT